LVERSVGFALSLSRVLRSVGSLALADPVHIDVLRQGPRAWNAWREQNPLQIPDLEAAALSLGQRQWGPVNGGPINLQGARLSRTFLRSSCLSRADLNGADLSETDLNCARLDHANLSAANLAHAVLDDADLSDSVLTRANLIGTRLRGARGLTQAQINETICDLTTVFPEHLIHPISTLDLRKVDEVRNIGESRFFSALVSR
jgi:hypothetical protein